MANISKFYLDGQSIKAPLEWRDIVIKASFGGSDIQPSIQPLEFTFVNENAKTIRDYIAAGTTGGLGIFEGLDFKAQVENKNGSVEFIDGFLDLSENYGEISPVKVRTNAKLKTGLVNIDEQVNSFTFDLLYSNGTITNSDFINIPYVVEKKFDFLEVVVLSVTLAFLVDQLATQIEKVASDIAQFISKIAQYPTGTLGAIIFQALIIIARLAYLEVLRRQIEALTEQILENFYSPVRNHKGMTWLTMLQKGFEFLGYELVTPLTELSSLAYLPSKPSNGNSITVGIPRSNEASSLFSGFLSKVLDLFNAKLTVFDGKIHLRNVDDPFFLKNSTFTSADVLLENVSEKRYNTEEMIKSFLVTHETDLRDDWTLDNYRGTTYVSIISPNTVGDVKKLNIAGFEQINSGLALGTRKDGLSNLEEVLQLVFDSVDTVIKAFGFSSNYGSKIQGRVGMLKQSNQIHSVPKMLYLDSSGRMPINHRSLTSAKYFFDTYINGRSLVANNFYKQRIKYSGVKIPFGLSDFNDTINNSYFYTPNGSQAKFENDLEWHMEKDYAIVDFWIKEIYTTNLKEIGFENS